jgi:hypothetical protein
VTTEDKGYIGPPDHADHDEFKGCTGYTSTKGEKPFTHNQMEAISSYYELKARSYERFLGCAFTVVTLLACMQVVTIAIVAAFLFGRG